MQKIRLLIFSLLIFLLSFSFFSAKSNLAAAKTNAENLSATASSQQESQSNYELPFPGILPDSPLYFLRIIRDRTVGFLIADPLKKSEFNLLQADKRLNAGIFLFKKGKTALVLSTISKAENYFSESLDKIGEAKTQGKDVAGMEQKLTNSLKKHEQELRLFVKNADANSKAGFEKELKRIIGFEERLSK
jgi:hypothetical protein